jgi:pSer/pThr/pTyr-binding forkhead associated (FHA) protein
MVALSLAVTRDGEEANHALTGVVFIGRAPDNHIVLDAPDVSRRHARVEPLPSGNCRLVDLGSANGTRLNGKPIEARQPVEVGIRDTFSVANYTFRLVSGSGNGTVPPRRADALPAAATAIARPRLIVTTPRGTREHPLNGERLTLGRGEGNDVVINEPVVSSRHAMLQREGLSYRIEDAGSTNGLWLNGVKVTNRLMLDGDRFAIGTRVTVTFRLGLGDNEQVTKLVSLGGKPEEPPAG